MSVMPFPSFWRAHIAPAFTPKPGRDVIGRLLPYNEELEATAAKYNVWRLGPDDTDRALARRASLAISEARERQTQSLAEIDQDLDVVLSFER
jgi:hypothetical protein